MATFQGFAKDYALALEKHLVNLAKAQALMREREKRYKCAGGCGKTMVLELPEQPANAQYACFYCKYVYDAAKWRKCVVQPTEDEAVEKCAAM